MKKIIRVLFFAFALVLFTGTVNAASKPELKVHFFDTRLNKEVDVRTFSGDKTGIYTYSKLGLSSAGMTYLNESIDGKEYSFIFNGWYSSEGTKIELGDVNNTTTVDGVEFYAKGQLSTLNLKFPELTENKEITLYSNWSDKIYKPNVEVHVYDNKAYSENSVYTRNNIGKLSLTGNNGVRLDLNQMFLNDSNTSYLRYDDKTEIVKLNKNASYYKFVKYVDSEGNEITDGYTSNLIKNVVFHKEYKVGNNTYTNTIELTFNSAKDANLTEDINFNVYVVWEEFTTAILEHEYIDEVSTGSGSSSNITGGAVSYTHTFSNPEDGTPMTHYDFLYWQHEESDDDQVDSSKEYKAGDSFTYNLSNKKSGWKGKVTTYAWWQPDVTLNLYSDGKLLSSESSFTSVSATEPTKYGYKFLGWYDKEGNKVEETTFYAAEKGINPEVREYTLYAKWERIMVDVKVSLVWDDNNNEDGVRPTSVKVELRDGEEVVETITLSEENNWTYTFNVPKYSEESEIEYTVSQEEVEYYLTTTTGNVEEGFVFNNFHEVWPKGQGGDDFEVVQTGNEVNYSLLLIGLFVELLFVKRKLFN